MELRSDTVSARLEPALRRQLEAVALARDTTVSDLIHRLVVDLIDRERLAYERLSSAFAVNQDLPPSGGRS